MTGNEALEELRVNILRDTSDSVAGESDQLFSDDALIRYIDEGVKKFLFLTRLAAFNSGAVCEIALESGTDSYLLDESVTSVLSVRLADAPALTAEGSDALASLPPQSGTPRLYALTEATRILRVYPTPDDTVDGSVLTLRVLSTGVKSLTNTPDALSRPLPVPDIFALDVLEWAAYRALRNHDADAEHMAKATAHKQRFDDAVTAGRDYAREIRRVEFKFSPNTRW